MIASMSWRLRKRLIHWLADGRYVVVNKPPLHHTPFAMPYTTTSSGGTVGHGTFGLKPSTPPEEVS